MKNKNKMCIGRKFGQLFCIYEIILIFEYIQVKVFRQHCIRGVSLLSELICLHLDCVLRTKRLRLY